MAVYRFVSAMWGAKERRSIARERGERYDSFGKSNGCSEESEFSPGRRRVCGAFAVSRDVSSNG